MFQEMFEEFNVNDYPSEFEIQLEGFEDDSDVFSYDYEFEYPYGTF
jgi:hypothetical protein